MNQQTKILTGIGAILVIGGSLIGISVANDQSQQSRTQSSSSMHQTKPAANATETIAYEGQSGKTALELLKASHTVKTKTFEGVGEYVESIDGRAPKDSASFWAFYVNGKQAQVGAGQYNTKDGEKIEWKLEAIQ